jgi:hypothetical protein
MMDTYRLTPISSCVWMVIGLVLILKLFFKEKFGCYVFFS